MVENVSSPHKEVGPERAYQNALENGEWQIQSCEDCQRAIFYPRNVCPHCGGDGLKWFTPSGRGTVYSKSIIYRAAESGGDYLVSLIDLDEGVRLMSSVVGCDVADVKIGMVVRASVDRSGAAARLVFHPAEERA